MVLFFQLVPTNDSLQQEWIKYVNAVSEEARRNNIMVLNPTEKKEDKDVKLKISVKKSLNKKALFICRERSLFVFLRFNL